MRLTPTWIPSLAKNMTIQQFQVQQPQIKEIANREGLGYEVKDQDRKLFIYLTWKGNTLDSAHPFNALFPTPPFLRKDTQPLPGQRLINVPLIQKEKYFTNWSEVSQSVDNAFEDNVASSESMLIMKMRVNRDTTFEYVKQLGEAIGAEQRTIQSILRAWVHCAAPMSDALRSVRTKWLEHPTIYEYQRKRDELRNHWPSTEYVEEDEDLRARYDDEYRWLLAELIRQFGPLRTFYMEINRIGSALFMGVSDNFFAVDITIFSEVFPTTIEDFTAEQLLLTSGEGLRLVNNKINQLYTTATDLDLARAVHDLKLFRHLRNLYSLDSPVDLGPNDIESTAIQVDLPYAEESPQFDSHKIRASAKWLKYGRFIVNANAMLCRQDVASRDKRAELIGGMLEDRFQVSYAHGWDVSDFTGTQLGRVLDAHHEGRFNED